MMSDLQAQSIRQHCKTLRMPTIGGQFARLAEAATREGQSHVGYLEALLAAEMEERESRAITRLLHEAKLPRMKTLEAFEFDRSGVSAGHLRTLAEGDYVTKAEPILLIGEAGTGKTHLATGLCVAACRQRRRVRFTTATALINELAEAAHANQLSRALSRWERLDLMCIDELGLRAAGRDGLRVDVPGDRRPCRESRGNRDLQPTVLGVVPGDPQFAAVQGADRSVD
jgi:DNA replication protein DnaC